MIKYMAYVLVIIIIAGVSYAAVCFKKKDNLRYEKRQLEKFRRYYTALGQWLALRQKNRNLTEWFQENKISSIAIYGMGELGKLLLGELEDGTVKVKFCIDRNPKIAVKGIPVVTMEEWSTEEVDAVVVSIMADFESVEKLLEEKTDSIIVSLETVIYEM